jgi:hypothetical protein
MQTWLSQYRIGVSGFGRERGGRAAGGWREGHGWIEWDKREWGNGNGIDSPTDHPHASGKSIQKTHDTFIFEKAVELELRWMIHDKRLERGSGTDWCGKWCWEGGHDGSGGTRGDDSLEEAELVGRRGPVGAGPPNLPHCESQGAAAN